MPKAVHTPDQALSNGQYLNLSMLFECLALDAGTYNHRTDSDSMERRFLSSLTDAEMSLGVRKGFGISGVWAKTFIAHYRDLVTMLAGIYLIDPECYGSDLLSTWPDNGTGARLILDTYRVEAIRILDLGSEEALSVLGLDMEKVAPEIGSDHFRLNSALGKVHVQRLNNLMR
ncbi:hypothetical protein QAO71_17140 (plasmid) [Halopseudomonas sp. SMJS2]|uniref:hypothetical protein n=1 Tax=Halopseudomonas sp. SMJS2 TaxID=3041098 RepID=UPI002453553E|nr:hypothetical protein [Halopseudomonas sp. SMJS2]WGK63494.1 hypothetical protein QAO71_17140 [Halopseudomonas sp. SMJS2]